MSNKHLLLILLGCFTASACSQKERGTVGQPTEEATPTTVTYDMTPTAPIVETPKITEEAKEARPSAPVHEPASDVEDAYEEGAAQAEEDRLAGHPGMNYANDYDDEDENEAYEEGYEDE